MVNSRRIQLDETFFAISDPTRREMLARLAARGVMTVAELSEPFDVSAPAISKHLRVLERAGLLTQQRTGRVRRCRLCAAPLEEAAEWVATYRKFWESQLDHLADYLDRLPQSSPPEQAAGRSSSKPRKKKTAPQNSHKGKR